MPATYSLGLLEACGEAYDLLSHIQPESEHLSWAGVGVLDDIDGVTGDNPFIPQRGHLWENIKYWVADICNPNSV